MYQLFFFIYTNSREENSGQNSLTQLKIYFMVSKLTDTKKDIIYIHAIDDITYRETHLTI